MKMGFRILMRLDPIRRSFVSRLKSPKPYCYSKFVKISYAALDIDHSTYRSESANFKIQRRWHVGHSQNHHDDRDSHSGEEGEKIFRMGLAADIGLAASKAITGYLSGSTAIIADAAHSVSDVVLSGVALLSFKVARTPKDKEHPYGHGKFETLGALGISGMLLATAGGIAWHALDVFQEVWFTAPEIVHQSLDHKDANSHHQSGHYHGIDMAHPILALNMTVVSIAVKEGLYWMTKRVGEKTGSGLMKANAWHHRADAVSSVIALIGSVMELVDAAVSPQDLEPYKETILGVQGVKGYNHLRGRRAGSSLYLDVDIKVDPFSSVSAAHDVGESVSRQIQRSHPEIAEVFIHIEPGTSHVVEDVINEHTIGKLSNGDSSAISSQQADVEDTVRELLTSGFPEKLEVQGITRHSLQGQIFLEIDIIMSPDILIREAAKVAKEAEHRLLEAVPNIAHISFRLQL